MAFRLHALAVLALLAVAPTLLPAQTADVVPAPPVAQPADGHHPAAKVEFFEKKIRPILVNNCYTCHSATTNSKGGLRVDDRNGLLAGGSSGAAIVPGKPEDSLLIAAVRYDGLEMPPKKKLSDDEIADLTQWIADGAAWPATDLPVTLGKSNEKYEQLRQEHWAWQPLQSTEPPAVKTATWPLDPIDQYILAKLEAKNLQPVGDAQRGDLIRRVTFDLTGLPPSPAEIDAFVNDPAPDAYAQLVERLLNNKAFGERWGRHWLDVARYGESTGSSRNVPYPQAWRYRNYVIDACNQDKPYDEFIREQIAGDLLPAATQAEREEQLIATGFLALGVKDVNQRFKVRFIMDNVDEQIDTVSRSVLGLTVSCARCHDHKFDPIPATDYYALAGIFRSSDLCAGVGSKMGGGGLDYYQPNLLLRIGDTGKLTAAETDRLEKLTADVAAAKTAFEKLRGNPAGDELAPNGKPKRQMARQKWNRLQAELALLKDANLGTPVLGVRDAKQVSDTELRIRGEAEKLGPVVPRGFLTAFAVNEVTAINPVQSGRLELAQWLTSKQNPLTPRVAVNRVWHHLFGQGLVSSVDNFGVTGAAPSHPELLDHLALRFQQEDWSLKKLIRTLVLTRTYRLSADATPANLEADPANVLVWRHSPRRLEAEEIRDATLAAAGQLNLERPQAAPVNEFKVMEIRNNGEEARQLSAQALASTHRSVYLPLLRGITPNSLELWDFAEQGMVTGSRSNTTVAPQALYLLNDPFVRKQSLALAERLLQAPTSDDASRIHEAYRWTLGRAATAQEIERARQFLADFEITAAEVQAAEKLAAAKKPAQKVEVAVVASETSTAAGEATPASTSTSNADPVAETLPAETKPKNGKKAGEPKPAVIDPDAIDQTDLPRDEVVIPTASPKTAAWAGFVQALFGSAEFRYVK